MSVFFAIRPPADVAAQLAALAGEEAEKFGGKPTRQDTIHLTLAFLGNGLSTEQFPALIHLAKGIRAPSFELVIDRVGFWSHNQLLWAGCSSFPPGFFHFADQLRAALYAAGYLPDREMERFAPHITLIRRISKGVLPPPLEMIDRIAWYCSGFELISSRVPNAVSSYLTLSDFSLASAA